MKITSVTLAAAVLAASLAPAFAGAGDPSRRPICASFARNAEKWNKMARSMGCRMTGPEFNRNEGQMFQWCMGTSDASFRVRSPQAAGHKANLEKYCRRQFGEYFSLN